MSRKRGRLILVATVVLAASAAAASCLDRPDLKELLSKPIIATKRDPNVDFASLTTFAITDTIPLLTSLDGGLTSVEAGVAAVDAGTVTVTTVRPEIAAPTLAEISAQLTRRGYRQVARTEGPDVGIAVTAVTAANETVVYGGWWGTGGATSPSYWGYSGGGFATSYGYSTVAWQSGSLIIEMYDLRAARDATRLAGVSPTVAAPTVPISVAWAALIHGIGALGATVQVPPIAEIQQAFIQSPYLTRSTAPSEVQ